MSEWEQIYGPKSDKAKVDLLSTDLGDVSSRKSLKSNSSSTVHPMGTTPFAMDNRDPNNLNPHCQVMFDDIIGEPEGLRTPDTCWRCSVTCYNGTRTWCYVILAVLFAPIIAFCSGCHFACLTFNQVWCVGPCLRLWKINLATVRKFWWGFLLAVCGPCSEILGLYFSKVKVRYQKLPEGNEKDENIAEEYFNV